MRFVSFHKLTKLCPQFIIWVAAYMVEFINCNQSIVKNFRVIFSKYGVEKYDAFDDVGGKLSFALALLDKENTGLILNAVHSRDNCFLYLKEIVKGESYVMLSQEEVEALRKAVNFELGEMSEDEKNLEK